MLINQYSTAKTTTSSWPIHQTHTHSSPDTHSSLISRLSALFWFLSFPMYCLPSFSLFPQSVSKPTSVCLQHISSLAHYSSSLPPPALFPQHSVLSVCVSASSAVHLSASLWSISVSFASGWLARQQALGPPLTYTSPEPVEKVFLDLIKLLDSQLTGWLTLQETKGSPLSTSLLKAVPAVEKRSTASACSPLSLCYSSPSDVAVPHPDKKSIIMYVTSLFRVLPQSISMEAIKEVETLPRPASATVTRVTTEEHYEIQTQQRFSQQVWHLFFVCVLCFVREISS